MNNSHKIYILELNSQKGWIVIIVKLSACFKFADFVSFKTYLKPLYLTKKIPIFDL